MTAVTHSAAGRPTLVAQALVPAASTLVSRLPLWHRATFCVARCFGVPAFAARISVPHLPTPAMAPISLLLRPTHRRLSPLVVPWRHGATMLKGADQVRKQPRAGDRPADSGPYPGDHHLRGPFTDRTLQASS